MKNLLFVIVFCCFCGCAGAQTTVSIAFYNTENLYDTIPSVLYDDAAYTPGGKYGWGTERYRSKLRNITRVIDRMDADVVGLCEVENETVTRDLVATLGTDYNYIHRCVGKWDGRELALLYKGDRFVPEQVRRLESPSSRDFLYVRGLLCGERIDLIVCHLPSLLNKYPTRERTMRALYYFVDSLHVADAEARLVVMGDFNAAPGDRILTEAFSAPEGCAPLLHCPFAELAATGAGSYAYKYSWMFFDKMHVSTRLMADADGANSPVRYSRCGVFIQPWMLTDDKTKRRGFPLRTFTGTRYTNGFSDHLPVYIYLEVDTNVKRGRRRSGR